MLEPLIDIQHYPSEGFVWTEPSFRILFCYSLYCVVPR